MEKPALIAFLKALCDFFERKTVPHQTTVDMWFEQVSFIPAESLPWIKAKIFEHETFPRNLPNTMKTLYREWLAANPEKCLKTADPGCKNCESGYLTVWYHDEELGRPYSHTFRCAYCNSDGYPRAMPAVTAQKLAASRKYFVHPRQMKFDYHDFFPVLETP